MSKRFEQHYNVRGTGQHNEHPEQNLNFFAKTMAIRNIFYPACAILCRQSHRILTNTIFGIVIVPAQHCLCPLVTWDHLELEFYDQFFGEGAYLQTHAEHMQRWHAGE